LVTVGKLLKERIQKYAKKEEAATMLFAASCFYGVVCYTEIKIENSVNPGAF
jgi:hypothetical protein